MRKKTEQELKTDKYLTKKFLERALKKYSANYIAKKYFYPNYQTHASIVIGRAKKFGIKTHSISEATKLKTCQDSRKKKLYNKHGCTNVSQIQYVKDKKIAKSLEKYGCINVFQSEEIKKKSKKTMIEKYGVEYTVQLSGYTKNSGKVSQIHKDVSNFLKLNKIKHINEETFSKFSEIKNKIYGPRADIKLTNKKIVIEVNGDMWHANPQKYKPRDIINTWAGPQTAKQIWEKDKIKKEHIESFGYKVLYIWEYDILLNKQEAYQRLLDEINKN